jgi:hypothetical protein
MQGCNQSHPAYKHSQSDGFGKMQTLKVGTRSDLKSLKLSKTLFRPAVSEACVPTAVSEVCSVDTLISPTVLVACVPCVKVSIKNSSVMMRI